MFLASHHRASLAETREPYMTMDMDIKERLLEKLKAHAPNTGLPDFHYPSFVKEVRFPSPRKARPRPAPGH